MTEVVGKIVLDCHHRRCIRKTPSEQGDNLVIGTKTQKFPDPIIRFHDGHVQQFRMRGLAQLLDLLVEWFKGLDEACFFIRLCDKGAFAGFPQQVTFIYQLGDGLAHRKAAYVVVAHDFHFSGNSIPGL